MMEQRSLKESKFLLFFIVVIEGFISIGVEIFSIRQMVPYVGSNILNTSIIIGIFLLFLSFGYYRGGIVVKYHERVLLNNLINSSLLVAIGLSSSFLAWFFKWFTVLGNLYGLILFSLLIIAPVTFLLGQTIPIITNFIKESSSSKISGTLLFLSTLGSFLGSILTSTILLSFLGVQGTLLIYLFLLVALIVLLSNYIKLNRWLYYLRIFTLLCLIVVFNFKATYLYSNEYSSVKIGQKDQIRYLNINHSLSSSFNTKTKNSSFKYALEMQKLLNKYKESKKVLVIGAGGFTLSLKNSLHEYTYVDVDKDLKYYSEKYLLQQPINGEFIINDIRYYLVSNNTKYDVIILDAFSNEHSIPPFLLTQEFFIQIKNHLKNKGELMVNFIGHPKFDDDYSAHFNQTINSEYNCLVKTLSEKIFSNMLYQCFPKKDSIKYSDNKINLFELARF